MNVRNAKQALLNDLIKEQRCGVWDAPKESLACQNLLAYFDNSYDVFLDVPSLAVLDNFFTLPSNNTHKGVNND